MAVLKLHIDEFLRKLENCPVIDVRSPGEFDHAHIPKAFNCPLFNNEERAAVGTAYKQRSREEAIKIGLDFFAPKMRGIVEFVESKLPSGSEVLMYCWRGGMRSAAMAWLLDLYGFKVYTLIGGYKQFRNWALDQFTKTHPLKIVGGYTGSGKTEVLRELAKNGEGVIDLEELACHKGSAFGNIGMPEQPSQEMFENKLALELKRLEKFQEVWLEDESQRIGHVNIPTNFWDSMRDAPIMFLNVSFEKRLEHIVAEYGDLDRERMEGAINRISRRLGGLETKNTLELLQMGKTLESFRILLTYYDRWYDKGLHNRKSLDSLLHVIECESVNPLNAKKLLRKPQLEKT